ncbi:MAG: aa3-type cytochrome c oxidase subunit IV [Verrucomicrobiaceae bacterium]|nr:MAG: aa3-type cytochrome c oxidase subunit IV [Verrucomicrobiaceae bacterium]
MADRTDPNPAHLQAHVSSYGRMIAMMKWGGLAVFLIAAFIVWLIA